MANLSRAEFVALVQRERQRTPGATLAVPIVVRLLADQLTPVVAYRRLVAPDQREDPSFLLESVEGGERQGRYSILGAQPILHVTAKSARVARPDIRCASSAHARRSQRAPSEIRAGTPSR
jgi:anthranilate/para-aminobenzoate synthase component I